MAIPGVLLANLVLVQLALVAAGVMLFRRPSISPVLSAGVAILVGLWYVLPVAIRLAFGREKWVYRLVSDELFAEVALLEGVCLLGVLILFLMPARRREVSHPTDGIKVVPAELDARLILIVLASGWLVDVVIRWKWSSIFGADYRTRNALGIAAGTSQAMAAFGGAIFFETLFECFVYACAVASRWKSRWERVLFIASWLSAVALAFRTAGSGGRLALLTPAVLAVLWLREQPHVSRLLGAASAMAIATYLVFAEIVSHTIGRQRQEGVVNASRVIEASSREVVALAAKPEAPKTVMPAVQATAGERTQTPAPKTVAPTVHPIAGEWTQTPAPKTVAPTVHPTAGERMETLWYRLVKEAIIKFDSISAGALLISVEGIGAAGWVPYEGAALALVPRVIYPAKPVPGSRTGDLRGHPTRLAGEAEGGDPESTNVGVSPCAVSLWQLGLAGVVLLVFANALNLAIVNSLLLSRSLFTRAIGLSLVSIPSFVTLFVSADTVLLNLQRALVVFAVVYLGARLVRATPLGRFLGRDAAVRREGSP